jgi:hypothetical protein
VGLWGRTVQSRGNPVISEPSASSLNGALAALAGGRLAVAGVNQTTYAGASAHGELLAGR